jgi:drug/metabolite transporter (DMT)-like permease
MDRRIASLLLVTAALWGVPYLLIKIAVGELSPLVIAFGRIAIGAAIVAAIAGRRGVLAQLRGRLRGVLFLALVQLAGPFVLLTYGERHVSSSLAGVLVATTPIFTGLLAFLVPEADRPTGFRAVGLGVGIVGVALVLGIEVRGDIVGGVLCLGTSIGYAIGAHVLKRRFAGVEPIAVLAGTLTAAALVLLVPAAATLPAHAPSFGVVGAVVALGVFPTALAFLLAYQLIAEIGPSRLSVVAYIAPCFAVVFGAVFRSEAVGTATIVGLLTVLAGSWLAARKPPLPKPAPELVPVD